MPDNPDPRLSEGRAARIAALRACVAERLFLGIDAVQLESKLISDLGADSLDFVDLLFQLEKRFGVQFRDGEFIDHSFRRVTPEGYLLPDSVSALRAWLPSLHDVADPEKVTVWQVLSLITVETLLVLVEKKLADDR